MNETKYITGQLYLLTWTAIRNSYYKLYIPLSHSQWKLPMVLKQTPLPHILVPPSAHSFTSTQTGTGLPGWFLKPVGHVWAKIMKSYTASWQKICDKNDIISGFSAFLCRSLAYKSRTIQWKIILKAHFEKKGKNFIKNFSTWSDSFFNSLLLILVKFPFVW